MKVKLAGLLLPIAALIGVTLMAQKRAAGFLNFIFRGVAFAMDGVYPILRLNIGIQNPSNEQFVVRSLVGQLLCNGDNIGNVSTFQTVVVNPNSEAVLPVFVRLNPISIVSDIITLISGGGGLSQTIRLKATVNVNNMAAPVDITYKIL